MSRSVIAVVGEALIDLVETGDDDPRLARPGGGPYNVAIGLARLGRPAAFVGRISLDPLGTVLRNHAQRSEVDLSLSVDAHEPTTVALVELADGIAQYRFGVDGTANFRWTDAELATIPPDVAALHFGSLVSWTPPGDAAVLRRVATLRDRTLISYDPNVRPLLQTDAGAARNKVERGVGLAHLVKTSDEDLRYLYPDDSIESVADRWLALGPSLVVVTHGGDGASAHNATTRCHRDGPRVEVADTVGAGDAFMSGLLDSLAGRGWLDPGALSGADERSLGAVLDDASLVAAITCSRPGANPPRRSEVDAARQSR